MLEVMLQRALHYLLVVANLHCCSDPTPYCLEILPLKFSCLSGCDITITTQFSHRPYLCLQLWRIYLEVKILVKLENCCLYPLSVAAIHSIYLFRCIVNNSFSSAVSLFEVGILPNPVGSLLAIAVSSVSFALAIAINCFNMCK